jgi:hypothetical protein
MFPSALVVLMFAADPAVELPGSQPSDTPGIYKPETVDELRKRLNGDEFYGDAVGFSRQGDKLFPLYLELLEDRSSEPIHVGRVYVIITRVEADRSRFYPITVERLSDKNEGIRCDAINFLVHVGSEKDTASLATLLYDHMYTVRYAAATSLVVLGGKKDLQVFDLVLRHMDRYLDRDNKPLFSKADGEHYEACRAKLEARLKKEEREATEKKLKAKTPDAKDDKTPDKK